MLCACSGSADEFKLEEAEPGSPDSLATRDFSAGDISSSRTATANWASKLEDAQVDEAESTLKEALSLNYEEARALLGRLEYQRGNFDAALKVFEGIDIRLLSPRMSMAIAERASLPKTQSKTRSVPAGVMSLHSVSLLLEAILLKANSLVELGRAREAARECKVILDIVESALPQGLNWEITKDGKLLEMFHKALELLPKLWLQAGSLDEVITGYRRALMKPWNLDSQRLAKVQKDLAAALLYGGVEASIPSQFQHSGEMFPESSTEESILLLFVLMEKILNGEITWDPEIMDYLTFALTISGQFEALAGHTEQILPGIHPRAERWYLLALCYSAAGQNQTAVNLLKKAMGSSEDDSKPHLLSFLLGAKLCSQDPSESYQGIKFAHRAIDFCISRNKHILSQAYKFLGICCGNAARTSASDHERAILHSESLKCLIHASLSSKNDPEITFRLGLENAVQRNLASSFDRAMMYSKMSAGSSARGWKLLALVASADQRFQDSEAIINIALDETTNMDQLELLRLKAVIQVAEEQPKQATETYRVLLALLQGLSTNEASITSSSISIHELRQVETVWKLKVEAWLDLASLYADKKLWLDSDICIKKAKETKFYSPRCWHETGKLLQAQRQYKEAVVAFSISTSIEPNYVPSIVSTAQLLIKMSNESLPIAKSFLMHALRLEPTNHDAWLNLGLIFNMEGLHQQAADSFQAAHELKLTAPVQSFQ